MSADHQVTPVVRSWLEQRSRGLADPYQGFEQLLELVDATSQVRRRWWAPGRSRMVQAATSVTPAQAPWRSRTMGSALGVISFIAVVALGTGALHFTTGQSLSPVPTAVPSPSQWTTPPGLVTEEVEPGIWRVRSDGVRDLSATVPAGDYGMRKFQVAAGLDGSVWAFWPDSFFRLGDPTTYTWGVQPGPTFFGDIEVGPDGTLWRAIIDQPLLSFDDGTWTSHQPAGVYGVEVLSDGVVWAAWSDTVGHLKDGVWDFIDPPHPAIYPDALTVSVDGTVWVWPGGEAYFRLDGRHWEPARPPISERIGAPVVAGPRGTLWARQRSAGGDVLTVMDPTGWAVYGAGDGVPTMFALYDAPGPMVVAPDGDLWVMPSDNDWCGGLASFDRLTWSRYLPGTCVFTFDIAPDGSVWLQGASTLTGPAETYVIDPQAASMK